MNRKSSIALTLALTASLSAWAPLAASAGSPLLSGYGGPGAGEQALIGSTLLGGAHGGAGSGGSSGSAGSGGVGLAGSGGPLRGGGGSTPTGAGGVGRTGSAASPISARARAGGSSVSQGGGGGPQPGGAVTSAFVYPPSLRSASADSPALGISGSDLMLLVGMLATLTLVGTLTIRLARLQR